MKILHRNVPIVPGSGIGGVDGAAVGSSRIVIRHLIDAGSDRHFNRGMAWQID
jgi:hypothetical protein